MHVNHVVFGVFLIFLWGLLSCLMAVRGIGLLELLCVLKSRIHDCPGSGAFVWEGGELAFLHLLHPTLLARCTARPYRHGRWVRGTKLVFQPHLTKYVAEHRLMNAIHVEVKQHLRQAALNHASRTKRQLCLLCISWIVATIALACALATLHQHGNPTLGHTTSCPLMASMKHLASSLVDTFTRTETALVFAVFHPKIVMHTMQNHGSIIVTTINHHTPFIYETLMTIYTLISVTINTMIVALTPFINVCHKGGIFTKTPQLRQQLCTHLPTFLGGSILTITSTLKSLAPIKILSHSMAPTAVPNTTFVTWNNTCMRTHPVASYAGPSAHALTFATHPTFTDTNTYIATPPPFGGAHSPMAGLVIVHAIACTTAVMSMTAARIILCDCIRNTCNLLATLVTRILAVLVNMLYILCCMCKHVCAIVVYVLCMHLLSLGWPTVVAHPLTAYMHCILVSCLLWLCLYVLYCLGQPPCDVYWFLSVPWHVFDSTVVRVAGCGLFAAIAAEIRVATGPRR